ncbi:LPS export ABC transporter permease LptG [Rhodosalinus halophilus]|uniref:LPS export ABC transporter permease LptG n=1 Tax=Rhodosalinus halophilus TaxID=2259333 RepID=A0A365U4H2_9RHOB|nr:LPS export ABC transporter permease LptG [Rhodosalinus halophilus]RBI82938.1 LPS export ABC transporter permease LptG [Rhodosalinus halophilus]
MTLHLYFARRFAFLFLATATAVTLFVGLVDLVEQVRRAESDMTFRQVLGLTLLNLPSGIYEFLPLIVILSAIALFMGLARSSELVVTRAAGRSGLAALVGPAIVAALIGALAVAMLNPVVAATSTRYAELREAYEGGGSVLSIGREGLWLRQGDARGQTVIRAARTNPEATVLFDVSFVEYLADEGPVRRIEAARAELGDGAWQLSEAKVWPLGEGVNPEAAAERLDLLTVPSSLTQDRIRDSFGQPSAVAIWRLPDFIGQLEDAGFSARRHAVWLQMELARPLFLVALVIVAAGFTMRHPRAGRTGIYVLAAVLLGFGLHYIRNFAQILGETGQLTPWIAAWTPPVAALLLALGLVLQREEG